MRTTYVLARHELRLLGSLVLWLGRRTHGGGEGRTFGHARGQGAAMFGLAFVCVIELLCTSVLLREWPTAERVTLVVDVYTVVLVVALHAASAVRPHVLTADTLRVRRAAHVDLRVPLDRIAAVRRETRTPGPRQADGELDLAVNGQTSVTLELTEPVVHTTFLGRRRPVRVVRFHADEPDRLVAAARRG
ncbi:hypothetical protein A8713_08850 [Streptomyces sp. SAT1]|uniref:hypothetical protein n=1 Tax=Streptomyces sp. SAT1 TaxID=1849967 RepID=UPI0007DCD403|nr:hypothetical protein [Streptomyces sp. SAT1]ANH91274.1 hypothetical protein A8713_08850 [Streptomyces sp. SAT1]